MGKATNIAIKYIAMTDIAIVHNFDEYPGGGDLVALDIIEALVEGGKNVWVYTSNPRGLKDSAKYFLKDPSLIEKVEIKKISVSRPIKHPYNIYMITRKELSKLKQYDLVVFFDDIPKPAQELKKILVYAHYPHATRILLRKLVPYRYKRTVKGKLIWKMHSMLFKRLFLTNWNKSNIYVVANSTLTQQDIAKALKPRHLVKIYPPVQVEQITEYLEKHRVEKDDEAVYIGRIQPEKGIDDIIKALALIKNKDIRATVIGFHFDNKYLKYLKNLARGLGVKEQVVFKTNAARREVLQTLARAKILVHPAHYEPFGIAVVEGMAAGCTPVVRRGLNGPWIDIVEKGKYSYGYSNIAELADEISKIVAGKNVNPGRERLIERAQAFSEQNFKHKITKLVQSIV